VFGSAYVTKEWDLPDGAEPPQLYWVRRGMKDALMGYDEAVKMAAELMVPKPSEPRQRLAIAELVERLPRFAPGEVSRFTLNIDAVAGGLRGARKFLRGERGPRRRRAKDSGGRTEAGAREAGSSVTGGRSDSHCES
jgi:hypothetical protein